MPTQPIKQVHVDGAQLASRDLSIPISLTWREAVVRVLTEEGTPMRCPEIAKVIQSKRYYKTDGATPAATVNTTITTSIKEEGEKSPFRKVCRGTYTLRLLEPAAATIEMAVAAVALPTASPEAIKEGQLPTIEQEPDESVIRCLGMYWQRDLVIWKNEPKIFGKQQASPNPVDFGSQRGIYILYDHHTVVYVGRSVDRSLGKRLCEHTVDRLGSRWNRFSWFGLRSVTDKGTLVEAPLKVTIPSLIATLEALLIEALEPPQNRKRGDDFTDMEYIQDIDPEIKERDIKDTLRTIERSLRGF